MFVWVVHIHVYERDALRPTKQREWNSQTGNEKEAQKSRESTRDRSLRWSCGNRWSGYSKFVAFYSIRRAGRSLSLLSSFPTSRTFRCETKLLRYTDSSSLQINRGSFKLRITLREERGEDVETGENDVRSEIDESHEQPVCFDLSLFHRPADETNTYTRAYAFPLDHSISMEESYTCGIIYIYR